MPTPTAKISAASVNSIVPGTGPELLEHRRLLMKLLPEVTLCQLGEIRQVLDWQSGWSRPSLCAESVHELGPGVLTEDGRRRIARAGGG